MEKNKCCCKENHEVNENKLENVTGGSIKSAPVKKYKCPKCGHVGGENEQNFLFGQGGKVKCPKCGYESSEADLADLLFI